VTKLNNAPCTAQELPLEKGSRSIAIEFHDFSARYPLSNEDILENINLQIGLGEKCSIIGRSGSGANILRLQNFPFTSVIRAGSWGTGGPKYGGPNGGP
jgi:ABC-type transport system involved in cytochrome bd biosynthesis fused ATPase/permease subunit